jgi:hypothetical protein
MRYQRWYDELFDSVRQRHPLAAVPGFVGSPMDDRVTQSISRPVIDACEAAAADPTLFDLEMLRAATGFRPARTETA